ncbi:hypothetical protein RCL_jg22320.t1 [Rhizophagus clarus]|uniref:Uncharacterized protein n=1 Tax=Rhizophagus clarus TaxID=94130 RepID=A0A8H3L742_9GLOM|nr:hypothetical protein RCL_jg22320.t1 [Rhizophagus clarus]
MTDYIVLGRFFITKLVDEKAWNWQRIINIEIIKIIKKLEMIELYRLHLSCVKFSKQHPQYCFTTKNNEYAQVNMQVTKKVKCLKFLQMDIVLQLLE